MKIKIGSQRRKKSDRSVNEASKKRKLEQRNVSLLSLFLHLRLTFQFLFSSGGPCLGCAQKLYPNALVSFYSRFPFSHKWY